MSEFEITEYPIIVRTDSVHPVDVADGLLSALRILTDHYAGLGRWAEPQALQQWSAWLPYRGDSAEDEESHEDLLHAVKTVEAIIEDFTPEGWVFGSHPDAPACAGFFRELPEVPTA